MFYQDPKSVRCYLQSALHHCPREFRAFLKIAAALVAGLIATSTVQAGIISFNQPTLDRWMYPFNATPGTRTSASVFGSPGDTTFDDRDAEFLIGFNTASQIATGLGVTNYQITAVKVTLTINLDQAFAYDPTTDSYRTYLSASDANFVSDGDDGRPIELFGAGFRNGYTALTFAENARLLRAAAALSRASATFTRSVLMEGRRRMFPIMSPTASKPPRGRWAKRARFRRNNWCPSIPNSLSR